MDKNFLKTVLVVLVVLGTFSCKKETLEKSSPSMNYFPVKEGKWIEYSVDSIVHADNDNNNDDSVYSYHYFIREVIDSSFIDGAGREAQVIIRYKRFNSSDEWTLSNVWTQVLTSTGAYRTEDNLVFEKLAFPISRSTSWNGNSMNMLDEEIYSYEDLHQSYTIANQTLDSTIRVVQVDENNYIERRYGSEVYAAGIGVVYKQRDDLEKRLGIVIEGLEYSMAMVAYGE